MQALNAATNAGRTLSGKKLSLAEVIKNRNKSKKEEEEENEGNTLLIVDQLVHIDQLAEEEKKRQEAFMIEQIDK